MRVPFDYCKPSIRVTTETIECIDKDGKSNHLLVITIPQSSELHANQQDDVYYRMGDKSKKLNFDERLQLMYAKGSRYMENADLPAPEYTVNSFMLNATIRNGKVNGKDGEVNSNTHFDDFNKNELFVYEAIATNPAVTRADLIEALDISARTIDRVIKSLKDKGAIERIGSDKTGHWTIIK